MGLQQNLNNIQTNLLQAKTAIAQSISNKGVECSADDQLSSYASKIDSITGGGTGEKFVVPDGMKFGYSTAFDPTIFDTSQVTDMSYMFNNCSGLTSLDLSNWNTSNVTNMGIMFNNCSELTSLDLSNWNTSNVTNMGAMFYSCIKLTSLNISTWNVSNVTDMHSMFSGCTKLTNLDLSNWNVSNVTNIYSMFDNCLGLTSLDLSTWDTNKVTTMQNMFSYCKSLSDFKLSDLGHNEMCNKLDLSYSSKLTKDSVLFLFNNAFDRATAGYTRAFTITLNAATKALLSDDELAIATNKGFTVV